MSSNWLSYIPYHVAQDILRHPGDDPIGREQRFDSVVLFADVSGFTAISESLGSLGRAGTEELTEILNQYFRPMIDLIQSFGGIIGKFGGDSMTVLFPTAGHKRSDTILRAVQCALDMQANMSRYAALETSAGVFSLAMKAGIAAGPVFCSTIGVSGYRLEYVIAGSPLDRCAEAEHLAKRGEVVVHSALLAGLDAVIVAEQRGDFSCVAHLQQRTERAPLDDLGSLTEDSFLALQCFLPAAIAQRIDSGQAGLVNEHRRVTILFVKFSGFDYDHDPEIGSTLQRYLSSVLRIVQRYDGYLNKVDMGDKGSKAIVLFGAPLAHENDEERALHCALEITALSDVPAQVGVNSGYVFCGFVGSEARREYTVMGDAVNLAARLMQATHPRQVLISDAVQRRVLQTCDVEQLDPIHVKGKSEPVNVYDVRRMRAMGSSAPHAAAYALPMIGRQSELQRVRQKIDQVRGRAGRIIGISAEAGMGKSRLKHAIDRMVAEQGFLCLSGGCESYGTNISYLVWQSIWSAFFRIDTEWPGEVLREYLEDTLTGIDAALVQRLPLLGSVLNISLPDNEFTAPLDARLRVDLLQSLLLTCLRTQAEAQPLVLFLEDCHWIDPLSQELVEFIGRNIHDLPVMLVLLYRPAAQGAHPLQNLKPFAPVEEIHLSEFAPEEAHQLIELKLRQLFGDDSPVPPELVDRVTAKAQGNPFYIEEMINLIHDREIDPQDQNAWQRFDLPDSLHSLIMSRIDQLRENEKTTLKVASVIGRSFRARWVRGAYPPVGTDEEVQHVLTALSRLDLTPLDRPEPELEYIFKHVMTQEVAYESLAFAMRATLHEQVGQFIEQTYPETLERYLDVLALHYGHSHNADKQRVYFVRAGDAAMATYANDAAVAYFERALPLCSEAEQADLKRKLGDICQLIGQWDAADDHYRGAMTLAELAGEPHLQARCQSALGHLLWNKKAYDEAFAWLARAEDQFEQLGDWHGMEQTAGYIGYVYWEQGDHTSALTHFERQLQIAAAHDDRVGVGDAVGNMGIVHSRLGELDQALECYERQLQIAEDRDNRQGILYATVNIGTLHGERGEYAQALTYFDRALHNANEMGFLRAAGVIVGNSGEVYRLHGDYDRALACYEQSLQIVSELGDLAMILLSVGNIAALYAAQAQNDEAEQCYRLAVAFARAVNIPYFLCEHLYGLAELCGVQARWQEAQEVNDEALAIAAHIGRKDTEFNARLAAIRLRVKRQQIDTSAGDAQIQDMLTEWLGDDEQAALRFERWRLAPDDEDLRQETLELYETLYTRTSKVEYRERYAMLGGSCAFEPPELPSLSGMVISHGGRLAALLAEVAALNERLTSSDGANGH